jgi:hypothetical protein
MLRKTAGNVGEGLADADGLLVASERNWTRAAVVN